MQGVLIFLLIRDTISMTTSVLLFPFYLDHHIDHRLLDALDLLVLLVKFIVPSLPVLHFRLRIVGLVSLLSVLLDFMESVMSCRGIQYTIQSLLESLLLPFHILKFLVEEGQLL
jgi:hypothetical protein